MTASGAGPATSGSETSDGAPAASRQTTRRRRLVRPLLVVCLLALAVLASSAALLRSAPDERWYYAANLGVLLRLQPFPQADQVAVRSYHSHAPRTDAPVFKVTWYTTRAAYVVPRGTSPAGIVSFYRFQLEPLWSCRTLKQEVVVGDKTVARMPGLQASQGDMFVTVLTSQMVGADGKQVARPRYTVQVDYRVE
jgi:hypothetical protein